MAEVRWGTPSPVPWGTSPSKLLAFGTATACAAQPMTHAYMHTRMHARMPTHSRSQAACQRAQGHGAVDVVLSKDLMTSFCCFLFLLCVAFPAAVENAAFFCLQLNGRALGGDEGTHGKEETPAPAAPCQHSPGSPGCSVPPTKLAHGCGLLCPGNPKTLPRHLCPRREEEPRVMPPQPCPQPLATSAVGSGNRRAARSCLCRRRSSCPGRHWHCPGASTGFLGPF